MTFVLGAGSLANIAKVDPRLVAVAKLAITLSTQDFGFSVPQWRTPAEEEREVAEHFSETLHSHHLVNDGAGSTGWEHTQPAPGFCGALDAVPWDGAKFVWDWPLIYPIAAAFKAASFHLHIPITWGGVWGKLMSEIPGDGAAAMQAAQQAAGGFDGPHYELGAN
jgi:peptidoglycan L-alanyl-D-glutamate endopeptidase CwlK